MSDIGKDRCSQDTMKRCYETVKINREKGDFSAFESASKAENKGCVPPQHAALV